MLRTHANRAHPSTTMIKGFAPRRWQPRHSSKLRMVYAVLGQGDRMGGLMLAGEWAKRGCAKGIGLACHFVCGFVVVALFACKRCTVDFVSVCVHRWGLLESSISNRRIAPNITEIAYFRACLPSGYATHLMLARLCVEHLLCIQTTFRIEMALCIVWPNLCVDYWLTTLKPTIAPAFVERRAHTDRNPHKHTKNHTVLPNVC